KSLIAVTTRCGLHWAMDRRAELDPAEAGNMRLRKARTVPFIPRPDFLRCAAGMLRWVHSRQGAFARSGAVRAAVGAPRWRRKNGLQASDLSAQPNHGYAIATLAELSGADTGDVDARAECMSDTVAQGTGAMPVDQKGNPSPGA